MKATAENDAKRADSYIPTLFEHLSRNECVKLMDEGKVFINGKPATKKQSVKAGDEIEVIFGEAREPDIVPENIPLDIIYQDEDIAIINKPQGMVVHPAHGHYSGTLVHAIMYNIKDLSGINGIMRPGIVHRLDKNTSGLIAVAKNDTAHEALAKQFKDRECEKIYLALAEGVFKEKKFTVENYIARSKNDRKKMAVYKNESEGKFASTEFEVLEQFSDYALVSCKLNTGRTHQIRLHLASVGHPCLGDAEYGFKHQKHALNGQALHSYRLTVFHPRTHEKMTFVAPLPEYMQKLAGKCVDKTEDTVI